MSNPFDGLIYVEGDWIKIPSGLSNRLMRKNRKHLVGAVGKQNSHQSHLNTWHRKDMPTVFDDEGEIVQTAGKALYRVDMSQYADEQALIDHIYDEIIIDLNDDDEYTNNPPFPIGIVRAKIKVTIIGNQQETNDHIAANKSDWGEAV